MLLKGKWVLVKQELLLWWHVLRWGEVIWHTAGSAYVSKVSWNATCDLCRRENTKDLGLCRMCVKIIPFMMYSSCITSARKTLRMQSNGGWSHWTCHNMDIGCLLAVESWYHEISVGTTRASHSLSQSVHAGRSEADLPLQVFTSSWSLPLCSPSLRHGISNPHATIALHTTIHQLPWTSSIGIPSAALHSCCVVPEEEGEGSAMGDGPCLHVWRRLRETSATEQSWQPPVQISKKAFTLGLQGTSTTRWIRNWLDGHTPRVTASSSMSKWRPVTSDIPQGLLLGPALFNIYVSNMDSRIKRILSKFADHTKLCGAVDTLEGRDTIQRDLNRLERWACVNLLKFNKAKWKVLHLRQGNPQYQYTLGDVWVESSPAGKDLGIQVEE